MFEYFLVFIFQVAFNILKVHEIKFSYEEQTKKLIFNSLMLNTLTILSLYFSMNLMLSGDWIVMVVFVFGGALGKWIATSNFNSHRSDIWKKISGK